MDQGLPAILRCIYMTASGVGATYFAGAGTGVNNYVALVGDITLIPYIIAELLRVVGVMKQDGEDKEKQANPAGQGSVRKTKSELSYIEKYFIYMMGMIGLFTVDMCVQKVFIYEFCI